jgi:UrcA family protein
MMKKHLILAALVTIQLGVPAYAEPASTQRTAFIHHSDLDLATKSGQDRLKHRIWRAAANVCGTAHEFDLEGKNEVRKCRRETAQVASAQADELVAAARGSQPIRLTAAQ